MKHNSIVLNLFMIYLWFLSQGKADMMYYIVNGTLSGDISIQICSSHAISTLAYLSCNQFNKDRTTCVIYSSSCIASANITFTRTKYCTLSSSSALAVTVFSSIYHNGEAYMALPVSQWGKAYFFLIRRPSGFVIGMTEQASVLNVTFSTERGMQTTLIRQSREGIFEIWHCLEMARISTTNHIGVVNIISDQPVGIISGACGNKEENHVLLETVLPDLEHEEFVYYSFCIIHFVCTVHIYNAFEQHFTVYMEEEMEFNGSSFENKFLTVGAYARIECGFALHVEVYLMDPGRKENWEYILTSCILIPAFLFATQYHWKMPVTADRNKVIIIVSDSSWPDLVNNFKIQNFELGSLADIQNLTVNGKAVGQLNFPRSPNSITFSLSEAFGCYAFGYVTSYFLVPVGLKEYNSSISSHGKVAKTKTSSTTTLTSSRITSTPTTFTTTTTTKSTTTYTITTTTSTTTPNPCVNSPMNEGDGLDNDCDGYIDEEMKNTKDDDNDGKIDEDIDKVTENGCLPGWFGTYCDKMCRCQDSKCKPDGECWENVTCSYGYFGTNCQYTDAIIRATVSHHGMRYRSPKKCGHYFTASSPLTVTFEELTTISWIQIEAESRETLLDLSISFAKAYDNQQCNTGRCTSRRDVFTDNNTLIIYCKFKYLVCQLNIGFRTTKGIRHFCAVYVSQGRNVALRKPTSMSSYFNDSRGFLSRGSLSVDGHIGDSWAKCATTSVEDSSPKWGLSFVTPMLLDAIIIHFKAGNHPKQIFVEFQDEKNYSKESLRADVYNEKFVKVLTQVNIHTIRISLDTSSLVICEFEAYGECAPPFYGPDCEDICSITCIDQVCSYEGYCRQCARGTGGPYCFDGCPEWCDEYVEPTDTTTATTHHNLTGAPYHRHTGSAIENFWFYLIIISLLVIVLCVTGLHTLETRQRKKENTLKIHGEMNDVLTSVEERNIETPSLRDILRITNTSTSVDVSKSDKTTSGHSSGASQSSLSKNR